MKKQEYRILLISSRTIMKNIKSSRKSEKVKGLLTNSKILLKFAVAPVIESLRMNPELNNFGLYNISNINNDNTTSAL